MRLVFHPILALLISLFHVSSLKSLVKPNFVPYCIPKMRCRNICSCEVNSNCSLIGMNKTIRDSIHYYHNQIRDLQSASEPQAAGMTMLQYDDELEEISTCFAARCSNEYSDCFLTSKFPETSQSVVQLILDGEESPNIFLWMQMMNYWSKQATSISVETIKSLPSGKNYEIIHNFAQLMSDEILFVGCAWSIMDNLLTFVCTYGPRGPLPNEKVYKIGQYCSLCPEHYECDHLMPFKRLCKRFEIATTLKKTPPIPPPPATTVSNNVSREPNIHTEIPTISLTEIAGTFTPLTEVTEVCKSTTTELKCETHPIQPQDSDEKLVPPPNPPLQPSHIPQFTVPTHRFFPSQSLDVPSPPYSKPPFVPSYDYGYTKMPPIPPQYPFDTTQAQVTSSPAFPLTPLPQLTEAPNTHLPPRPPPPQFFLTEQFTSTTPIQTTQPSNTPYTKYYIPLLPPPVPPTPFYYTTHISIPSYPHKSQITEESTKKTENGFDTTQSTVEGLKKKLKKSGEDEDEDNEKEPKFPWLIFLSVGMLFILIGACVTILLMYVLRMGPICP